LPESLSLCNNKNNGAAVFTAAPFRIAAQFLSSYGAGCLLPAKVVMAFRIPLNMSKKSTPFQRYNADCKNPYRKKRSPSVLVIISRKKTAVRCILRLQKENKEDFNMSAINVGKENYNEIVNSGKKVLLDFWAPWCGPCRMVLPIVEEIASERDDILVGKVNVDEQPELASKFNVMSIPTLVVMENGKILSQSVGAKNKNAILNML
jgi:thioredoxin 1